MAVPLTPLSPLETRAEENCVSSPPLEYGEDSDQILSSTSRNLQNPIMTETSSRSSCSGDKSSGRVTLDLIVIQSDQICIVLLLNNDEKLRKEAAGQENGSL